MKEYSYDSFKAEVIAMKRKFRMGVNKLWPNANDKEVISRERNSVLLQGSMLYTFANNGDLLDIFRKGYERGDPTLYDLLQLINERAINMEVNDEPIDTKPESEYLKKFRETFPHIKIVNGRCSLIQRLKEGDSLEQTFNYFVEMYALQAISAELAAGSEKKEKSSSDLKPIEWLGTQKHLADLLVTLKEKGWIDQMPAFATIKAAFTKSASIEQVLKPSKDKQMGVSEYEQIYTSEYKSPFDKIKKRY